MHNLHITVDDPGVPQLLTSALKAYEIGERRWKGKKEAHGEERLETFELLWGYIVSGRNNRNARIIVTVSTVETSAFKEKWIRGAKPQPIEVNP